MELAGQFNLSHTRLCSSHEAAERPTAQTWSQSTAKVAHGDQEARCLKQMGLTVLSRKSKRKRDCMHASEPVPGQKNLSCPPLCPSTVLGAVLKQPAPSLRVQTAMPSITASDNHLMLPSSTLEYKYVCALFAPILPVAKIRSLNQ